MNHASTNYATSFAFVKKQNFIRCELQNTVDSQFTGLSGENDNCTVIEMHGKPNLFCISLHTKASISRTELGPEDWKHGKWMPGKSRVHCITLYLYSDKMYYY